MDPGSPTEPAASPEADSESKPSFWSTLAPAARRVVVIVGVVALVVGLLGGFAAGFKVEQNRVKTTKSKAKAAAKPKVAKSQKITRLAGVVTVAGPDSITVTDTSGFHVKIATPSSSVAVKKTAKGTAADIKVGGQVLLRGKKVSTGVNEAAEILVVPSTGKLKGLKVTKIDGDKVTVTQANGKPLTIEMKPTTTISTLGTASASDIKKGAEILANGNGTLGHDTFVANEIVILPPASAFASKG